MSWGALHDEDAYRSGAEVALAWKLKWAEAFIRDTGRWDDYRELMDSPVVREEGNRVVR